MRFSGNLQKTYYFNLLSDVGPVNLFHSSLFQQVDVYLQDKLIGGSNNNYAYKAMIDVLLGENLSNKSSNLQSQLYYKDAAFGMDDPDAYLGQNFGLKQRAEYIKESRVLELEGPLYTDISQLSRFMLNNVDLKFVLWQSSPEFHLMCGSPGKRFRTKILNATLNVCHVYVSPHILIAHARVLAADHPAIYPFKRSEIKRYVVSAGSYSFSADDVFLAQVPNQIVLAMVEAQSVAGSYSRNPFNFKHFRTNYISLQVNGENTPSTKPLTTKFSTEKAEGTFLPGFLSLQNFKAMSKGTSNDISRLEYSSGYTMMCYDLDQMASNDPTNVKALSRSGNVRCEIIFDEPLETSINVIFYAQYDSEIRIDKTRSVEIIH